MEAIKGKWSEQQQQFFEALVASFTAITDWEHDAIDAAFKATATAQQVKPGQLMLPLRVMLVGGKFGPGVFDIAAMIGKQATIERIQHVLTLL
jgi:glutamyl-tRNA synthetase